jgi:hypothetical protein
MGSGFSHGRSGMIPSCQRPALHETQRRKNRLANEADTKQEHPPALRATPFKGGLVWHDRAPCKPLVAGHSEGSVFATPGTRSDAPALLFRHSRESGNPDPDGPQTRRFRSSAVPACKVPFSCLPRYSRRAVLSPISESWIPAFAGMTEKKGRRMNAGACPPETGMFLPSTHLVFPRSGMASHG